MKEGYKRYDLGGYSNGVPPLPIPNREVKPINADGTAFSCGRVGSRLFKVRSQGLTFFLCLPVWGGWVVCPPVASPAGGEGAVGWLLGVGWRWTASLPVCWLTCGLSAGWPVGG